MRCSEDIFEKNTLFTMCTARLSSTEIAVSVPSRNIMLPMTILLLNETPIAVAAFEIVRLDKRTSEMLSIEIAAVSSSAARRIVRAASRPTTST